MGGVIQVWRRALLAAAFFVGVTASPAQQAPDIAKPPQSLDRNGVLTLHAAAHLVILDVVVTRGGHTVEGLKAEDFHLLEDNQEQKIRIFEEHSPVDPAQLAQDKAALAASLRTNTFTDYEPLSGNAVTVLLFNELLPLPINDFDPLRQSMIDVIVKAPPETPFIVFQLDRQLRLVQGLTTNRDRLLAAVDQMWKNQVLPSGTGVSKELTLTRREVLDSAVAQLNDYLGSMPGKKNVFAFTGGFQAGMPMPVADWHTELSTYLCSVMDLFEQGRMSIYRYYPDGQVLYGFGCDTYSTTLKDVFNAGSHYYTLYYSPTNADWNGKYRKFKVNLSARGLHATYRPGYFARPENAAAHQLAIAPPPLPAPDLVAPTMGLGQGPLAPVVFTVTVAPSSILHGDPAGSSSSSTDHLSEDLRMQPYRDFKLHYVIPATDLKVARELTSTATGYIPSSARVEVAAVAYQHAHLVNSATTVASATFESPTDSMIQTTGVTADLTIRVPLKADSIRFVVHDVLGDRAGDLQIPLKQIVMPPE